MRREKRGKMRRLRLPIPLTKSGNMPSLPSNKLMDELSRKEARKFYREMCKINYPEYWQDMMKEYNNTLKDEPEENGHIIQLSALLAYYAWWY